MAWYIAFDFDGVLVDSKSAYIDLIMRLIEESGFEITRNEVAATLQPSIRATIERLIKLEGGKRGRGHKEATDAEVKRIERRIVALTAGVTAEAVPLCPDVADVLKALRQEGHGMFIVTNSHSSYVQKILENYRLSAYFDRLFTVDSKSGSKNEALRTIAASAMIPLGDLIYIGDTIHDVALAKRVGCRSVIVLNECAWGYPDAAAIREARPDHLIERLAKLLLMVNDTMREATEE